MILKVRLRWRSGFGIEISKNAGGRWILPDGQTVHLSLLAGAAKQD